MIGVMTWMKLELPVYFPDSFVNHADLLDLQPSQISCLTKILPTGVALQNDPALSHSHPSWQGNQN